MVAFIPEHNLVCLVEMSWILFSLVSGPKCRNVFMLSPYSVKIFMTHICHLNHINVCQNQIHLCSLSITCPSPALSLVGRPGLSPPIGRCGLLGPMSVWLIWQTLVWFVWHSGVIICTRPTHQTCWWCWWCWWCWQSQGSRKHWNKREKSSLI